MIDRQIATTAPDVMRSTAQDTKLAIMGSRLVSAVFVLCVIANCATPNRDVRKATPIQSDGVQHTVGVFEGSS